MDKLLIFVSEIGRAWRYAVARRDFQRLDAAAMRDLGIAPSEFDSYWAESHGMAERTRRRVDKSA